MTSSMDVDQSRLCGWCQVLFRMLAKGPARGDRKGNEIAAEPANADRADHYNVYNSSKLSLTHMWICSTNRELVGLLQCGF